MHSGVWLLWLQLISHMALPAESQSCKLRNCINTGQKDCVCPQRPAYKYKTAGTCQQKGKRNSEMKDAWKKGLAHGRSGKETENYEEESILWSAKTVSIHIAQRLI